MDLLHYITVSTINAVIFLLGVGSTVISHHALAQWRLNRPAPKPVPAQPQAGTSKGAVI